MTFDSEFKKKYESALKTRNFGRRLELYDELDSTSNHIKRRLDNDEVPEGLAAVAFTQTGGRGRLGRVWNAEPGAGLYISFLTGEIPLPMLQLTPVAAGVAAVKVLRELCGAEAGIKWPNDVLIGGKKVSGILCEARGNRAVIGIGINISQTAAFFENAALSHATSLLIETGKVYDMALLAASLANYMELVLDMLADGSFKKVIDEFRGFCVNIGREVRAISPNNEVVGRAVDIDGQGRLVIDAGGELIAVSSGEVQLRMEHGDYN